jgi:hypothetical protein
MPVLLKVAGLVCRALPQDEGGLCFDGRCRYDVSRTFAELLSAIVGQQVSTPRCFRDLGRMKDADRSPDARRAASETIACHWPEPTKNPLIYNRQGWH